MEELSNFEHRNGPADWAELLFPSQNTHPAVSCCHSSNYADGCTIVVAVCPKKKKKKKLDAETEDAFSGE